MSTLVYMKSSNVYIFFIFMNHYLWKKIIKYFWFKENLFWCWFGIIWLVTPVLKPCYKTCFFGQMGKKASAKGQSSSGAINWPAYGALLSNVFWKSNVKQCYKPTYIFLLPTFHINIKHLPMFTYYRYSVTGNSWLVLRQCSQLCQLISMVCWELVYNYPIVTALAPVVVATSRWQPGKFEIKPLEKMVSPWPLGPYLLCL